MEIKRCYPVLVGASVAENQLVKNGNFESTDSVTALSGTLTVSNNIGTLTPNGDFSSTLHYGVRMGIVDGGLITGHKHLVRVSAKLSQTDKFRLRVGDVMVWSNTVPANTWTSIASVVDITTDNTLCTIYAYDDTLYTTNDSLSFRNCVITDLTAMFGSTIADYAYTLEKATAGSGIAWLRSYGFLTDDYVPYNTGTIESVEATAKVVRDENGENAITYPLGNDTLRGLFKLDANNNLYADGDRKEADGTITRKYAYVDLGSLNWAKSSSGNKFFASVSPAYPSRDDLIMVCSTYAFDGVGNSARGYYGANKTIRYFYAPSSETKELYVTDESYSDAVSFKNAVSGQYIVYELATPTTEQSTPFTSPQVCYPDGTEEFVTENGVPVGHESKYQL